MYGECKAFDAAAFIGKWGEIYSVARYIVNAKIKQCKYRSEKLDLINIATSNQIWLVDKDYIIYLVCQKYQWRLNNNDRISNYLQFIIFVIHTYRLVHGISISMN